MSFQNQGDNPPWLRAFNRVVGLPFRAFFAAYRLVTGRDWHGRNR